MKKYLLLLCCCAIILWSGTVFAQTSGLSDAIENMSTGAINWTTGEIVATGIGAPPSKPVNQAQARAMTERAAYVVALRNLLETVKGVQVDSVSVVENFMVKSDVIRARVNGIVNGARVVDKKYMSDGSVEVKVAMTMKGKFLDALVPETFGKPFIQQLPLRIPSTPQKPSDVKPAPPPPQPQKPLPPVPAVPDKKPEPTQPVVPPIVIVPDKKPVPTEPATPPVATVPDKKPEPIQPAPLKQPEPVPAVPAPEIGSTLAFKGGIATGVVLDGRGLGLKPALLPKIMDAQGQEIYVGQIVTRTNAVEQGVAGYAKDVNAAANNFRVTDNPAVIKGLQASGPSRTDVVVGQADAQMLRQLSSKGDFLQYCRVIIVY
jgi:hypothetical protein